MLWCRWGLDLGTRPVGGMFDQGGWCRWWHDGIWTTLGSSEAPHLGRDDGAVPRERIPGKPSTRRWTPAEKEQAVRVGRTLQPELGTEHGTIQRVAARLGYGVDSVRSWVRQADIDDGQKPGVTTADAQRIKTLEQENKELKRANEILRRASAFLAAELDRPQR